MTDGDGIIDVFLRGGALERVAERWRTEKTVNETGNRVHLLPAAFRLHDDDLSFY